ncbi:MAG: tetratricopeptide repeat protein [Alphaproteobacteria bacterium]|nr:tetratricopeptide repeat protein [Alphaproteobacteria bacterium]
MNTAEESASWIRVPQGAIGRLHGLFAVLLWGLCAIGAPGPADAAEPITAEEFLSSPAATAFKEQRYEDALQGLRDLLQAHPDDVLILQYIGITLDRLERFDEAMETFDQALALDPQNVPIRLFAGVTAYKQREAERATELFQSVLDLAPGSPYATRATEYLAVLEQQRSEYAPLGDPRRWHLYAQVGGEYDTNVNIGPDDGIDSQENSARATQFLAGGYDFVRDGPWRAGLDGSIYQSQHGDTAVDDLNLGRYLFGFGFDYTTTLFGRPVLPGLHYSFDLVTTEGNVFSSAHRIETSFSAEATDRLMTVFRHEVNITDFRENGFDPDISGRSGVRNLFDVHQYVFFENRRHHFFVAYNYELDRTEGDNFDSFSHLGLVGASIGLPAEVRLELRGEAGLQIYPSFRAPDDRRVGRWSAGATLSRPIVDSLVGVLGYDYSEEDSNFEVLEFDRHVISFSLGYTF